MSIFLLFTVFFFLTQRTHHLSYIFMAGYWNLGWSFKTTPGIVNVISWSRQCTNCFTTYCHACCNSYNMIVNVLWKYLLLLMTALMRSRTSRRTLGSSFTWLMKNRLVGRQKCVGDWMEKSNLWLSSIATRWADSSRAAIDLSFHCWGETVLLKCQA